MSVFNADITYLNNIALLIAKFRVEINSYKGIQKNENIEFAKEEFNEYLNAGYPVFVYKENDQCLGYLVCRIDNPVVWVESLYTLNEHRKKGIASALFDAAEQLAVSYGEETLYIYVHPNNDGMIAFCNRKGYNVLNLLEIRKKYETEQINEQIKVRNNIFCY